MGGFSRASGQNGPIERRITPAVNLDNAFPRNRPEELSKNIFQQE